MDGPRASLYSNGQLTVTTSGTRDALVFQVRRSKLRNEKLLTSGPNANSWQS